MLNLSLKPLVLALVLVVSVHAAQAENVSCDGAVLAGPANPALAAAALNTALAQVSLTTASPAQLLAAYDTAVDAEPALAAQLAGLLALGRPDVTTALSVRVSETCPRAASLIQQEIDATLASPNADQLAALANAEGTSPAAGDDQDSSPE